MTAPTPSVIWVVGDGEGDVLHSTTDKDVADEHFQMCVDEPNDFRSGPYTLTEYVPKRDLAARDAELAELMKWKEAVINELIVAHIYGQVHDDSPRKAVHDAITWNCQVALDPAVSSDAQRLRDTHLQRAEAAERDAFTMAAGQCIVKSGGLMADDHGHQYCDMERQRDEWKRKAEEAARDAVFGQILMRYIDRLDDPTSDDTVEIIASELSADVHRAIAALAAKGEA